MHSRPTRFATGSRRPTTDDLISPRPPEFRFFNSLTHGVDWGPIMRWDMPVGEMVVGVLQVFILGWLLGAAMASLYNFVAAREL